MVFTYHIKALRLLVIMAFFCGYLYAQKTKDQAPSDTPSDRSLEALDKSLSTDSAVQSEEDAKPQKTSEPPKRTRPKQKPLPTANELIEAKLSALKKKQDEQELLLAGIEKKLASEEAMERKTFDTNAYLWVSVINSAPPAEYKLDKTEVYLDGKLLTRGGRLHQGLPYFRDIYFGPISEGCHEILAKATYVRIKNDLISRFKVNRIEKVERVQSFVAKNGYRVELEIEGFEAINTIAQVFKGPELRFNTSVRENFLLGAPIVSMEDVLKQGRVRVDYITEADSGYNIIGKSLSIDGLPILVNEHHDELKDKTTVFNAPLSEGKHTLNVTLNLLQKRRIGGGPLYKLRLTFDRDFFVISGQTTIINLVGLPNDGFRTMSDKSRYARATSRILSEQNPEFFPNLTCKELAVSKGKVEPLKSSESKNNTILEDKKNNDQLIEPAAVPNPANDESKEPVPVAPKGDASSRAVGE